MNKYGYVKVCAVSPEIKVADIYFNSGRITEEIYKAAKEDVEIIVFPELSLTGYTCGDLFFQNIITDKSEEAVSEILRISQELNMLIIIGNPVKKGGSIYNCAIAVNKGKILGIVPKSYLPEYNEFYEKRWFDSGNDITGENVNYCGRTVPFGTDIVFESDTCSNLKVGIEICEDLWAPVPPSTYYAVNGATILVNLSASNELIGKSEYRETLIKQQSARCIAGYVYASSGHGESSTDMVFGGHCIIAENGRLKAESERFVLNGTSVSDYIDLEIIEADRKRISPFRDSYKFDFRYIGFHTESGNKEPVLNIDPYPFVPGNIAERDKRCSEIFHIQTNALIKRMMHTESESLVIGISGGLDSTLALLVCCKAVDKAGKDRKMIKAVTMPGFGTTDRTYMNSKKLTRELGVEFMEIDIKDACINHFRDINHDENIHDTVYENTQARERTQILMDLGNKYKGIVVGTGDLSEAALGWSTYNGDHMSMYAVNCGIPKTLIRYLIKWVSENEFEETGRKLMEDILNTPVSPELLPPDEKGVISQKTEAIIGEYDLHDFFLYYTLRYGFSPEKIFFLALKAFDNVYDKEYISDKIKIFYKRFIMQQYKRSCMPDGPKVGSICLSPRGDWRMPSDASLALWEREIERITMDN